MRYPIAFLTALALLTAGACAIDEASEENAVTTTPTQPSAHRDKDAHHAHHKHAIDPAAHAAHLQDQLGLTDDQTRRVEQAIRDNNTMETRIQAVIAILTPDQRDEFERLRAEHHKRMREKHAKHLHADPAAHADHLQQMLGLTDDQRNRAEAIFRSQTSDAEKIEALRAILTAEQLAELERLHQELKAKHGHGHKPHE